MNQINPLTVLCVCLSLVILYTQVRFHFERKRYLDLIDRMSDKLMSRNFTDYAMGQSLKDDKVEPFTPRIRTDTAEAVIEQLNHETVGKLEGKLKHLDDNLEKVG